MSMARKSAIEVEKRKLYSDWVLCHKHEMHVIVDLLRKIFVGTMRLITFRIASLEVNNLGVRTCHKQNVI